MSNHIVSNRNLWTFSDWRRHGVCCPVFSLLNWNLCCGKSGMPGAWLRHTCLLNIQFVWRQLNVFFWPQVVCTLEFMFDFPYWLRCLKLVAGWTFAVWLGHQTDRGSGDNEALLLLNTYVFLNVGFTTTCSEWSWKNSEQRSRSPRLQMFHQWSKMLSSRALLYRDNKPCVGHHGCWHIQLEVLNHPMVAGFNCKWESSWSEGHCHVGAFGPWKMTDFFAFCDFCSTSWYFYLCIFWSIFCHFLMSSDSSSVLRWRSCVPKNRTGSSLTWRLSCWRAELRRWCWQEKKRQQSRSCLNHRTARTLMESCWILLMYFDACLLRFWEILLEWAVTNMI